MSEKKLHVVIVGGGLVGTLQACFMAKRGFRVDLYELRNDIRKQDVVRGRSINLALSQRGRDALKLMGLEDEITTHGIPMYGRMIHDMAGNQRFIQYGKSDQYIMSIDRRRLNELLLTAAEKYPNVTIHFDHKLVTGDFLQREVTFQKPDGSNITVKADLLIGCDGAFSSMRRQLMKAVRVNYSQEYVPHGYMELRIPPKGREFAMDKNSLHIWPRSTFMMIALPNVEDKSFVVTLFMPWEKFESIKTQDDLYHFFDTTFPDAVPFIGREELKKTFFSLEPLPLMTVKCTPYHVEDKAVIMGDAAHAMVPFYGQGMNCGFEDCLIMDQLLDKNNNNIAATLRDYTRERNPDAKAICDLALYNYVEMRSGVTKPSFIVRKKVDNLLHWLMPKTWIPLYTMVSFTRTRYNDCIQNRKWQDKVLGKFVKLAGAATVVSGTYLTWQYLERHMGLSVRELLVNNRLVDSFWRTS